MPERLFGHVPGYPEGSVFESRTELSRARVHVPTQAGISGSEREGAESIVLSGGYEDDEDFGDEIIYTGHGGRDLRTGRQIHDQPFSRGNRALALSKQNGLPVRVIRGWRHKSQYAPRSGYRYDGLYAVESYWCEHGTSGFLVWRFHLVKIPERVVPGQTLAEERSGYTIPGRREIRVSRVVRDTALSWGVKRLYDHRCQMCGIRLECPAGPYSEAAHIRPLGSPHNGPDAEDNILCLCPNHHVLFDNGAVAVADDLALIGEEGALTVRTDHPVSRENLAYHREHFFVPPSAF